MKSQLFLDSLRVLISNIQTSTMKILTNNSSLSYKAQDLSLSLLQFKISLIRSIQQILQSYGLTQLLQKLEQQASQTAIKLKKLSIHAFLKKKIRKFQKQSMTQSISQNSFDSSFIEDPKVSDLKKSIALIQKDIGIQQQNDQNQSQVSRIVKRSMESLQITPIKSSREFDTSMRIQDSYVLPQNLQTNGELHNFEQKKKNISNQAKTTKLPLKKKKVVMSTSNTNNKTGMFDNLLSESLDSWTGNSNKL